MKKYNIGWGLTNACNMNCMFCYSKETRAKNKDISINEWIQFVDENHEQIDSINYGTGENSLIDDFFYFVRYVRSKYPEIAQSVTTNGYVSQRIKKSPMLYETFMKSIDEVDVSLDFADRDKHCIFRGQERAFDWAMETLELLKTMKKKTTIVFIGIEETLTKENIDGLFLIAKKYNALLRLNVYRPVSKQMTINDKFILSYNTLVNTLEYINKKYKIIGLSDALLGNIYSDKNSIKDNTGIGSIRILPNGQICPSTYLISDEYSGQYSIREKNVLSSIKFDAFENAVIPCECKNCPIVDKCKGGVYDRRILWYKTLTERDPYCPTRHGEMAKKEKLKMEPHGRISIHDDYLPTLFFSNKESI